MLTPPRPGQIQAQGSCPVWIELLAHCPPLHPTLIPSVLLTVATGIDYSTKRKWELEQEVTFL